MEDKWIHPRRKDAREIMHLLEERFTEYSYERWPHDFIVDYLRLLKTAVQQTLAQILNDIEEIHSHDLR